MSGGEANRLNALREKMIVMDERSHSVGLHEIEQLGESGQQALTHYVLADYVGAHGVPVPVEWDALVARNAGRPMALLIAATGIEPGVLGIDCDRMDHILATGDAPTTRELVTVLRELALAVERRARRERRKNAKSICLAELSERLAKELGGEVTITSGYACPGCGADGLHGRLCSRSCARQTWQRKIEVVR